VYRDWHHLLHQYTLSTFHRQANTSAIAEQNPRRIAQAFLKLNRFNYKKEIKILLEMPLKSPNTP
jgi:CRISPR system Cascade subunit CasA